MQIVLLAIVIIVLMAYFNIDLRSIFANPEIQKMWNVLVTDWNKYLKPIATYLFTNAHVILNTASSTATTTGM